MSVLGALVLQQLGGSGKRGRAVHARVQRQQSRHCPASLLLSAGRKGMLARQAGERSRELRAGKTGAYRAVVVMKMMMGMGVRKRGVCAFLVAQNLGAGL